jgi:putative tryptophan/tyrosine transport system substrate-binding protein
MRRIGVLIQFPETDPEGQARIAAFRDQLQKLGWSIGANLQIDYRWGVSTEERARSAAAELLELTPDVISANSTLPLRAVQQATRTVPIVFTTIIEPIGQGFVANLAHPGGNTTGFSYLEVPIGGKWVNLLKEIAPPVTHVGCMFNPQRGPYSVGISHFAQEAAQRLGVQYIAAPVFEPTQIESVVATLAREPNGGLIISPDAFTVTHRQQIIALALATGYLRSTPSGISRSTAVWFLMGRITSNTSDRRHPTWIEYCAARSPPICLFSSRASSIWLST